MYRYLQLAGHRDRRVLVLKRGPRHDHKWLVENHDQLVRESLATLENRPSSKKWAVSIGFGGASNQWWACTPRLLPEDFELAARYCVGADWPISYDELEPHHADVEEIMQVSGSEDSPSPRSRPYPQPRHNMSLPDTLLKRQWGELFVEQPNARARRPTRSGRAQCGAAGVCNRCPVDSKFTILNELSWLYDDPTVELLTEATADHVDVAGDVARGVVFGHRGREQRVNASFVALGANAIFNPFILIKSGLGGGAVGRGLCEQVGVWVIVDLAGVDNFQCSTSITGHGYPFYAGAHRRERAAALIETWNKVELRNERGKYRHRLRTKFLVEDFRRAENRSAPRRIRCLRRRRGFTPNGSSWRCSRLSS